jgi:sodium/hydrogen exchanger 10/11
MAVVALGITLRAERTVISPDSEGPVHHFWEIFGYLTNTVLFVLVGIFITETALNCVKLQDFWNCLLLYVTIHVSRYEIN